MQEVGGAVQCVSCYKSALCGDSPPLAVLSSSLEYTKLCSSPVFSSVLCISHLASVPWLLAFLHIIGCIVTSFSLLQPDLSWSSSALTVATSFSLIPVLPALS